MSGGATKIWSRPVVLAAALAVITGSVLGAWPADAARAERTAGGLGEVSAISCTSAGSCTAVGELHPPSMKALFTVSEKHGAWGSALAVPGIAALLGRHPFGALIHDLSCPSAGNCGAGGYQAMVVSGI